MRRDRGTWRGEYYFTESSKDLSLKEALSEIDRGRVMPVIVHDIFKIQMPITTNDPEPKALVYNRSESIVLYMKIDAEVVKVMRERLKAYFKGHIKDDKLVLEEEMRQQNW